MEKLLALITILQRAGGRRRFFELFSRMIVILVLVIVTAIMISATFIGGIINMHIALLNDGMSPMTALLLVASVALFIIAILIGCILYQCKRLHHQPRASCSQSPIVTTLEAFVSGLMGE
jgi:uncharacterized membrane protein